MSQSIVQNDQMELWQEEESQNAEYSRENLIKNINAEITALSKIFLCALQEDASILLDLKATTH